MEAAGMPLIQIDELVGSDDEEEGEQEQGARDDDAADVASNTPLPPSSSSGSVSSSRLDDDDDEDEDEGMRGVSIITNDQAGLRGSRQFPFARYVVIWFITVSLLGGVCLYFAEKRRSCLHKCVFLAMSAVTNTGLSPLLVSRLRAQSQLVLLVLMQLGAASTISLVPVVLRLNELKRLLPKQAAGPSEEGWWRGRARSSSSSFDVHTAYRRVPQWVVEYKALVLLCRVVVGYQLVCYAVYGLGLYYVLTRDAEARELSSDAANVSPGRWVVFTVVSSFTNTGLSLQPKSFIELGQRDHAAVLFMSGMLTLHGNVLFPACLRWSIVFLSFCAKRGSSRKVFYRYLLLHGRSLYSSIFASQQTWLLVATQLSLITLQAAVTLAFSWQDVGLSRRTPRAKIGCALFEAVNTRHSGATAIDLGQSHGGTLVLQLAMMWLAPVPFVSALRSSAELRTTPAPHNKKRQPKPPLLGDEENDLLDSFADNGEDEEAGSAPCDETASPGRHHRRRRRGRSNHNSHHKQDDDIEGDRHTRGKEICRALLQEQQRQDNTPQRRGRVRTPALDSDDDDAMWETRLLLMSRYPSKTAPWAQRVSLRCNALKFHSRHRLRAAIKDLSTSTYSRDLLLLFCAWLAVSSVQDYKPRLDHSDTSTKLFFALFEIVSAFGNVGLSLGSQLHRHGDYARDLEPFALLCIAGVALLGRTRDLPNTLDAALTLNDPTSSSTLKENQYCRGQLSLLLPDYSPPTMAPLHNNTTPRNHHQHQDDVKEEDDDDGEQQQNEPPPSSPSSSSSAEASNFAAL